MREIKFRAWDLQVSHSIGFLKTWRIENVMEDMAEHSEENSVILQQFTGLKDKNGVEIYEGDILKCEQMQGLGEVIGAVHIGAPDDGRLDMRAHLDTRNYDGGLSKKHGFGGEWCCIHSTKGHEPIIIGNIYQNPELLK